MLFKIQGKNSSEASTWIQSRPFEILNGNKDACVSVKKSAMWKHSQMDKSIVCLRVTTPGSEPATHVFVCVYYSCCGDLHSQSFLLKVKWD